MPPLEEGTIHFATYDQAAGGLEPITDFAFENVSDDVLINLVGASIAEYVRRADKTVEDLAANPVLVATMLALADSYPHVLAKTLEDDNDARGEADSGT